MKVIIATGGTGGHIIPALEVARCLKKQGHEVIFIGAFRHWAERIKNEGFERIEELPAKGLAKGSVAGSISSVILMARSFLKCLSLVRQIRPDAVAGFGGYGAFPVVSAAAFLRYPTLFHEQNVVPGRANKILSVFVRRIAVSFERSKKYLPPDKVVVTGCPTHVEVNRFQSETLLKEFNLDPVRKTILVLGGSQGSHRINAEFMKVLRGIRGEHPVQVFHIAGKEDLESLKAEYKSLGIPFCLYDFYKEMNKAYQIADLVICRAGALSVTEIALTKKQAILIPYPFAQNHQKENAFVLRDAGVAEVIEEKDLTTERLRVSVDAVLRNPKLPQEIEERTRVVSFPDAAQRIAQEIITIRS